MPDFGRHTSFSRVVFEKNRIFSFGLTHQKYKKISRHGHSEESFLFNRKFRTHAQQAFANN
jgi:hypothetical protein